MNYTRKLGFMQCAHVIRLFTPLPGYLGGLNKNIEEQGTHSSYLIMEEWNLMCREDRIMFERTLTS